MNYFVVIDKYDYHYLKKHIYFLAPTKLVNGTSSSAFSKILEFYTYNI